MNEDLTETLVSVELIAVPIELYNRSSRHQQTLQREFDLLRAARPTTDSIPNTLLALIEELDGRYGRFASPANAELDAAVVQGLTETNVVYRLPLDAGPAARRLGELLDQADDFCRDGVRVLTLATPPEERSFREWFLGEFVRQLAGEAPIPWPQRSVTAAPTASASDPDRDASPPPSTLPDDWTIATDTDLATLVVAGDLDLLTAPSLRDALQQARTRSRCLVVDARRVGFMDSVAISVLVTARNRLTEEGGSLRIQASAAVLRSLQLVGLDHALEATTGP